MTEEIQTTTSAAGDTGTAPGQQAGQTPAEKMIAESQVNHIVAQRVAEAKTSEAARVLAQFADYDTLKGQASKWQEFQNSQKSDLQKLQETLESERSSWTTEKTTLQQQAQRAQTVAVELAFIKKAVKDGGLTLDRAEAAYKLLDPSKLKFSGNGEIENAAEVVTNLIEEYPFLKGAEPQTQAKPNGLKPTNPAGTSTQPDLSWHPMNRRKDNNFGQGGVIPPVGER